MKVYTVMKYVLILQLPFLLCSRFFSSSLFLFSNNFPCPPTTSKPKKPPISFSQLQMIRLQNVVGHFRWTLDQRILAPAAFRKGDHVAHASAAQ